MRLGLTLLAVSSLCPQLALGEDIKAYRGEPTPVTAAEHASYNEIYQGDEGYLERWMLMLHRDDGGWMQLSFVLSNIGIGDGHCAVDVQRHAPEIGEPRTRHFFYRWPQKFERDAWKASTERLDVHIDKSWIKKTEKGYSAYLSSWGYEIEIEVTDVAPAWKPGAGRIEFPGAGRYHTHMMPTHGTFVARERNRKGPWATFRGTAWGEHATTNMMPHVVASKWIRFRGRAGNLTVSYLELFTPQNWAEERYGWVVVSRGSKVVAYSLAASMTRVNTRAEKSGHQVPRRFVVEGDTAAGRLSLEVRTQKRIFRENVLEPLPKFIRRMVEMFVQPFMFYDRARFVLKLGGETFRGREGVVVYAPLKAGGKWF